MALFSSPTIAAASGSVGGAVYSRNRSGMYMRARAVPVNPQTVQQQTVRNAMSQLSTRWVETLTAAERAAWDLYAANVPTLNKLGAQINLTGQNMYVRSNVPRVQGLLSTIDAAPTTFDLGTATPPTFSVAAAADQVTVLYNDGDDWVSEDDAAMIIYAGRPQNASVNFFKGPYRIMGVINGDATTPPTSPSMFTSPFPLTVGQKQFFVTRVTRADGRLTSRFFGNGAVT